MWMGGARTTLVCLQCQHQIRLRLLRHPFSEIRLPPLHVRTQGTAAAIAEEIEQYPEDDKVEPPRQRKSQKRLRRIWKPPRIAELGVSSLGKPAEVLVLNDRDRQVDPAGQDGIERYRPHEPQLLETLQAENLPLSSENVKQSLEQISAPYRNRSQPLPAKDRIDLRSKIMEGFTQGQLRSYCLPSTQHHSAGLLAQPRDGKKQAEIPTREGVNPGTKELVAVQIAAKHGKAALVEYILKDRWGLEDNGDEETTQVIAVKAKKLEYILCHRQSFLKEYAERFDVVIDASRADRRISITGKRKHLRPAQTAINQLCREIVASTVRSVTSGVALRNVATVDFVSRLSRNHSVMFDWASVQGREVSIHEDRLKIYYHHAQDFYQAQAAERDILLAERERFSDDGVRKAREKISMWLPQQEANPELVIHHHLGDTNNPDQEKAWARWVLPQRLVVEEQVESDPRSPNQIILARSKYLTRQCKLLIERLKGKNDEFFLPISLRRRLHASKSIQKGMMSEEIVAYFGKILFPDNDTAFESAFQTTTKDDRGHLLRLRRRKLSSLSSELPGVPTFLTSLPPFEGMVQGGQHQHHYRLRYVPVPSEVPAGSEVPPIEIDITRECTAGAAATNRLKNAWSIIYESSHQLLLPNLAVDLSFVRRRKAQFITASIQRRKLSPTWLKWFEEQIRDSNPFQFPQFVKVDLPFPPLLSFNSKQGSFGVRDKSYSTGANFSSKKDVQVSKENLGADIGLPTPKEAKEPPNLVTIDYMLENWHQVYSADYRKKSLCLEHLVFENEASNETREALRLAPQPILDGQILQTTIPGLLEQAYKVAAHLGDPNILGFCDGPGLPATRTLKIP